MGLIGALPVKDDQPEVDIKTFPDQPSSLHSLSLLPSIENPKSQKNLQVDP